MAMTFDPLLPSFTIRTVDQGYSGASFELCIKCVSTKSANVGFAEALDKFTIDYRSPCGEMPFTPAIKDSYLVPLYRENLAVLEKAALIDAICAPIINEIIMDDSTAVTPVLFELSDDNRIFVHPTARSNLGNYSLRILSCV